MDRSLIGMLFSFVLSFAAGLLLYQGLFAYSFKRRNYFVCRTILTALGVIVIGTAMTFIMYGLLSGRLDINDIWQIDLLRAIAYLIFSGLGVAAMFFCFDEKPGLILFAFVAASATHTIGLTLYAIFIEAFKLSAIFFIPYAGIDPWGFSLFFVCHAFVFGLAWLLFARPFAKAQKEFGEHINKFSLGLYVMYAFFTAAISSSQYFNMTLMKVDSVAIPVIFNGFSIFFAVFVLFVQRFNLYWVKDVQQQEAASSFHAHYKERVLKQQKNMELIDEKLNQLKENLKSVLKNSVDDRLLDELQSAVDLFDNGIQTDNEALDLLLAQKSMDLKALGINTSIMVERKIFSFMDISDVNVFFGNAIDNAIEYLAKVDEEKRFLRISTHRKRSLLLVRIENYCEKEVHIGKDGLPRTSNSSLVSYSAQSIRSIAAKYDGTVKFAREGDLFVLTALFNCNETF